MKGNKLVSIERISCAIDAFPLEKICAVGSLPANVSEGIDVDWTKTSFCMISQLLAVTSMQLAGAAAKAVQGYAFPMPEACSYMMELFSNFEKQAGSNLL